MHVYCYFIFFFNDTATTEIYTLSLHDALPISPSSYSAPARGQPRSPPTPQAHHGERSSRGHGARRAAACPARRRSLGALDRKSTRLNSSHANISYAVFCLKKKNSSPILFLRFS